MSKKLIVLREDDNFGRNTCQQGSGGRTNDVGEVSMQITNKIFEV